MNKAVEIWSLVLIAVAFLIINFATSSRSPTVWLDEVCYADPGVNLATNKGFTSSAWKCQQKDEIWAGNTPLYPVLMAGWVKLFGFGIVQIRSLNYFLVLLAVVCFWTGLRQSGVVQSASTRLWIVALLLCGYNISFVYRGGRPDSALMLLFAFIFLACSFNKCLPKYILLGLASFLVPFGGLAGLPFLAITGLFWLFLKKQRGIADVAVAGVSSSLGLACLLALYWKLGLLESFRACTQGHSVINQFSQGGFKAALRWYGYSLYPFVADLSLWLLLVGMTVIVFTIQRASKKFNTKLPLLIFWFSFCTPIFLLIAGKFTVYYGWIWFVPLALSWGALRDAIPADRNRLRVGLMTIAVASIMTGLPLRVALTVKGWNVRDYKPVWALGSNTIKAGDIVYCDVQAYYVAKPLAKEVFVGPYIQAALPEEKAQVTLLIINPDSLDEVAQALGGTWVPVSENFATKGKSTKFGAAQYILSAYRRNPGP